MPSEERPAKVAERCEVHPNRVAAARCAECDRPVCVRCAVPVRGRVLGPECLRAALGDEAPPAPTPGRARRPAAELVAGAAFTLAVISTLLPWTRFASGSGFAGAWALDLRWSMLTVVGSLSAVVCWIAGLGGRRLALRGQTAFGIIGAAGAVLAMVHPPPFKHASIAPGIAVLLLLVGATTSFLRGQQASDLHR